MTTYTEYLDKLDRGRNDHTVTDDDVRPLAEMTPADLALAEAEFVRRLEAGDSSLDPQLVERFWHAAAHREPFDLDDVRQMARHDRNWADALLIGSLDSADFHALRAVAALDLPGWREHMKSALACRMVGPTVAAYIAEAKALAGIDTECLAVDSRSSETA